MAFRTFSNGRRLIFNRRFSAVQNGLHKNVFSCMEDYPKPVPERIQANIKSFDNGLHFRKHICTSSSSKLPDKASDGKGIFSYRKVDYKVDVKTGDQIHAGTDANVFIILHSETGERSEAFHLDYLFRDDFERGQLDSFQFKNIAHLKDIHKIEFWRDGAGLGSDWFVDYIEVEAIQSRKRFMFPVFRWIKPHRHYVIRHMDNCLPQFDPDPRYRKDELEIKKEAYQCMMKVPGGPSQFRAQDHKTKAGDQTQISSI